MLGYGEVSAQATQVMKATIRLDEVQKTKCCSLQVDQSIGLSQTQYKIEKSMNSRIESCKYMSIQLLCPSRPSDSQKDLECELVFIGALLLMVFPIREDDGQLSVDSDALLQGTDKLLAD